MIFGVVPRSIVKIIVIEVWPRRGPLYFITKVMIGTVIATKNLNGYLASAF